MTCEPSLHQQVIDELRRAALFGSERVLEFISGRCAAEDYGIPADIFDGPSSPHSGYASSTTAYYAAQQSPGSPPPAEQEVMSE
jgi:hypothetical protein